MDSVKGFRKIHKAAINDLNMGSALFDKASEGHHVIQILNPFKKHACPAERQPFLSAHILNSDASIEPYIYSLVIVNHDSSIISGTFVCSVQLVGKPSHIAL